MTKTQERESQQDKIIRLHDSMQRAVYGGIPAT